MSVTAVTSITPERLDDGEYKAALERLRSYREQLNEADQHADAGSLERAADLAALFADKRWVREMDERHPIKRAMHRGRPVDPEGRSRFAKWVMEQAELHPTRSYQLLNANVLVGILETRVSKIHKASEKALRPLRKLLAQDRADQAEAVWRRAVQLAEGEVPTADQVKKALADHDRDLGYVVPRNRTSDGQSFTEVSKRSLRDIEWIQHNGTDAQKALYIAELQKRLAGLQ